MSAGAQISTYPTAVTCGQPFSVSLVVRNPDVAARTIASIVPIINVNGLSGGNVAAARANPNVGAGQPVTVPGSGGSVQFNWTDVIHAPAGGWGLSEGGAVTYSYGALVAFTDGTVASAQPGLVTVVPIPTGQPSTKPQGGIGPSTPAAPAAPSPSLSGAMQMDYFPNSGLQAVLGV